MELPSIFVGMRHTRVARMGRISLGDTAVHAALATAGDREVGLQILEREYLKQQFSGGMGNGNITFDHYNKQVLQTNPTNLLSILKKIFQYPKLRILETCFFQFMKKWPALL
jgi:hypothetical protein